MPPDPANRDLSETDALARARAFAPELAAAAAQIDRERELPPAIVDGLVEHGFFRLLLPRSLGGAELLPLPYIRVIEAIAEADASTAWCLNQGNGCAMTAAYLDPAAAREVFGDARAVLAWGPGPGKAVQVPGGYRVTATWSFASGSHNATWLGAHVPVCDESGRPLANPDGSAMIRTALFPREAAAMTDIWHVIGLRGTGSDQFRVEDLFVPDRHVVWRDDGERREAGLLYRFSSLQLYAAGFASVALGTARAALDAFIELARDKVPWRAAGTLRSNHVIQSEVAQAEAKLASSRAWLHRLLAEVTERVACTGRLDLDQRMRIRLASTFAIHQALAVADFAYTAAGSTAIFENEAFERRFRDIHTVSQQLQGRRSHFETVGAYLMDLEADTSWL